ncbi:MAG: glycosyltransferase, partial [Mycobacterium sp.]
MTGAAPTPVFAHLLRMTDHRATFEHACMTEPRRDHGYCTDDMARVLV